MRGVAAAIGVAVVMDGESVGSGSNDRSRAARMDGESASAVAAATNREGGQGDGERLQGLIKRARRGGSNEG